MRKRKQLGQEPGARTQDLFQLPMMGKGSISVNFSLGQDQHGRGSKE